MRRIYVNDRDSYYRDRIGFAQTHHLMFWASVDEGESIYPESVVSVLILQQQHQQDQRQPV